MVGGVHVLCSHALTDDGGEHRCHGQTHEGGQRPNALGDPVGGDLIGAEQGDQAGQRHLDQLVDTVFHAVGQGDAHDLFQQLPLPGENVFGVVAHRTAFPEAVHCHRHSGEQAREQGRIGHTGYTLVQDKDAHAVAHDIDHVGHQGDVHGHLGLAHAPAQGSTGVIDRQRREGVGGDAQVGQAGVHHVRLHLAEEQGQQALVEQEDEGGEDDGEQC